MTTQPLSSKPPPLCCPSGVEFRNNGNQTQTSDGTTTKTLSYDTLNRLTGWTDGTKSEATTYRGAEWHRATISDGSTTTSFLYDGDNVVADYNVGVAITLTKSYVTPFLDQNVSVRLYTGEHAGTYYYTQDGLGSVRTLTNNSGVVMNKYDYQAFGETYQPNTTETVENRYQYTGREMNPVSGTMYYRYRAYNPMSGRFIHRDPAGYPNNAWGNLYDYVYGMPVNWVDAYGLGEEEKVDPASMAPNHVIDGQTLFGMTSDQIKNTIKDNTPWSQKVKMLYDKMGKIRIEFKDDGQAISLKDATWLANMIIQGLKAAGATEAAEQFERWAFPTKNSKANITPDTIRGTALYEKLLKKLKGECEKGGNTKGSISSVGVVEPQQKYRLLLGDFTITYTLDKKEGNCCKATCDVDDKYDFHIGKDATFTTTRTTTVNEREITVYGEVYIEDAIILSMKKALKAKDFDRKITWEDKIVVDKPKE